MKMTAVFVPVPEGGYSAYVEEIPGAISEGDTLEEARAKLTDALRMVLKCNREIARRRRWMSARCRPVVGSSRM